MNDNEQSMPISKLLLENELIHILCSLILFSVKIIVYARGGKSCPKPNLTWIFQRSSMQYFFRIKKN
jgi:hypothetical protein